RGADALVRVRRRHAHVEQHDVRRGTTPEQGEELVGVADGGVHRDALVQEEGPETLAQEGGVLGDHHVHGSTAVTVVGPPAGLATSSEPPSAAARPARPASPRPSRGDAPPRPSSVTVARTAPSAEVTVIVVRVAPACLATFARASATT